MDNEKTGRLSLFSFQKILIYLFSILFLGIIVLGIISYKNNLASNNASRAVKNTQIVIDVADQVFSKMKDVQLESNGYAITGDSVFLLRYKDAKTSLVLRIDTLRSLIADNPSQKLRTDSLAQLTRDLVSTAEQFIDPESNDAYIKQQLEIRILHSKDIRDKIKFLVARFKNEENNLLALREAANERSTHAFKMTFFTMLALIFLLMNVVFFIIRYNFKKQKRVEQKLRESEEQFRLLVNNVKDYAIFMVDTSGKIVNWNKGAEHIKGYTTEEIIGKHLSIFYSNEQIKRGVVQEDLTRTKQNGKYHYEGWRLRKDGSTFWADVIFTSVYDEEGVLKGFTNVTRDNTERRKAEQDIRNSLEKEKELNSMKSNFVAIASHEFRTPLSTILSSSFLLEKYNSTEQQAQRSKHIDRIKSSVQNLLTVLDDFLSLEKIEEGKVEQKIRAFNLKDLSVKISDEMKGLIKSGQSIEYNYNGPETVLLDPVFIRHILNNLLSNAIKYSRENGVVALSISVNETHITITVKDKGIGISKEDQKHLFERFFRASNTVGIQGTGLGLHIVKHYVDMLHGQIKMNSELDKGTEFVVEFINAV